MGATLQYAKVVDRDHLQAHGGLSPGTHNIVLLPAAPPAIARDFMVLRAWDDVDSAFEERWRIEDRHGHTVYTGTPRIVLAGHGDIADDIDGARFDYTDTGYQLVLSVDGREVARTDFAVAEVDDAAAPPAGATDVTSPGAAEAQPGGGESATTASADDPVVRELTAQERRALHAVTKLETAGTPGFAHDVAEHAGLDLDTARVALSGLTGHHDLVQEVPTGAADEPDLGPRYRVKARP